MKKNDRKRQKTVTVVRHPTNTDIQRLQNDIRQLLEQNKSDSEVMALLGLESRTYQRYVKRIHEEDKAVWYSITREELESQFLKLKQSFEETYTIARNYAMKPDIKCEDMLSALREKDMARMNVITSIIQGPKAEIQIQKTENKPTLSFTPIEPITDDVIQQRAQKGWAAHTLRMKNNK